MIKIEYNLGTYDDLLKTWAKALNCKIKDGRITIPKEFGVGYMRIMKLPNGLQAVISDFKLNKDLMIQRKKNDLDNFILRFDEIISPTNSSENSALNTDAGKNAVFLMSSKFDWIFFAQSDTQIKSINISFSRQWLNNFLGVEKVGDLIRKYLSLKISSFNYEPLDSEYKRIIADILHCEDDRLFESLIIQNRLMLLLERFFTRIYKKMSDASFDLKVSSDDLQRLMVVEAELLKDFSIVPPGIPKLARMAAMSPSKLKNSFRDIYGLPIYQYFQKHRMNKAKAMLLTQRYTVKEVGIEVGYSNLSNFAKAFKKSFDQLPSDILIAK